MVVVDGVRSLWLAAAAPADLIMCLLMALLTNTHHRTDGCVRTPTASLPD
jgi:hypothetical protein